MLDIVEPASVGVSTSDKAGKPSSESEIYEDAFEPKVSTSEKAGKPSSDSEIPEDAFEPKLSVSKFGQGREAQAF